MRPTYTGRAPGRRRRGGAAAVAPPRAAEDGAAAAATCSGATSSAARVLDPTTDYKPSNPAWLRAVAEADPADLPDDPQPPPLAPSEAAAAANAVAPGSAAAAAMFALDPDWTYLNHGSYGAAFRAALGAQAWHRARIEAQPVLRLEGEALRGAARAAARVAALVGADWRDAVPGQNATALAGAVIASVELAPGDLVLISNLTYPAVRERGKRGGRSERTQRPGMGRLGMGGREANDDKPLAHTQPRTPPPAGAGPQRGRARRRARRRQAPRGGAAV